ncbi:binding--dependent transport systems inner membrane component domain protein [Bacillus clarus]|uniref:Binding--dependent transport systems inner membrane component domain protein n=1 Tax=Bacillus clarus TaxID=2338372 RepID=A0A090YJ21_9BACI|nr:binding--dependent transport systems inner membrane component domain protein [Bacillus clarus]
MMGVYSYFKKYKSKNILNYLIAFEKNGEVLDYGTLCI